MNGELAIKIFSNRIFPWTSTNDEFCNRYYKADKIYWGRKPSLVLEFLGNLPADKKTRAIRYAKILRDAYYDGFCEVYWGVLLKMSPEEAYNTLEGGFNLLNRTHPNFVNAWKKANEHENTF